MLFREYIEMLKKVIALIIIWFFNRLPIKNNKIFMFSYYGNQYGCNPKYISEYIVKHYPMNKFDVVWAFNDITNKQHITGVRMVKIMSLKYFYELCTAKVIITNFRMTESFIKRKKQFYIQTWHSSLRLKQIEKDAVDTLPKNYIKMAKKDSKNCDLLLSGCSFTTSIFKRAFWYKGEIFEHGTPRNDLFFHPSPELKDKIFNGLNIHSGSKIVLYAPTFRKSENTDVYKMNFQLIIEKLSEKIGGNWIVLVKLHPHLISKSNQFIKGNNVIDVTSYDDTQELLCITDILISDYSSLIFDFAITKRPCFLYVPDLETYIQNDRNLYFKLIELPFITAQNSIELSKQIEAFSYDQYKCNLDHFLETIGSYEDGKACENLLNKINIVCFGEKGRGKSYATEAI